MSQSFTLQIGDEVVRVFVKLGQYGDGRLAVQLFDQDDEYCGTVSINIPEVGLNADEFVFKTYSENEGLLEAMSAVGIVSDTGRSVSVGLAGPQPICRLTQI